MELKESSFSRKQTKMKVVEYSADSFEEKEISDWTQTIDLERKYWIQIHGLAEEQKLLALCKNFGIHPLAVEDIFHTVQRPKIDDFGDSLFVVLQMFHVENEIKSQQISLFVKNNVLVSFEESDCRVLLPIEQKITDNRNNIRKRGEDYLLYSLLDVIIDSYFEIEEHIYKEIGQLENPINNNPKKLHLSQLLKWRKDILRIRKSISPVNDILHTIMRNDVQFFEKENKVYLRDLTDHLLRVLDNLDTHKESVNSLIELYHAQANNKMNEVMKTLTIMSSIFIPLSFIAGVYGMNFDNMPELHSRMGYFFTLGGMGLVAIVLLVYFKFKKYF
jgi:magnesium transporter